MNIQLKRLRKKMHEHWINILFVLILLKTMAVFLKRIVSKVDGIETIGGNGSTIYLRCILEMHPDNFTNLEPKNSDL